MKWSPIIVTIASLAAIASACGVSLIPTNGESTTDAGADAGSDGSQDKERDAEAHLSTFACGDSNNCIVGEQACCLVQGSLVCASADAGCPGAAEDAGTGAAAPKFLCTTYNNCTGYREDCCYDPTTGTVCARDCPTKDAARLCRLGYDGCGSGEDCVQMTNPPLNGVGECKADYSGSSSGTSGGCCSSGHR